MRNEHKQIESNQIEWTPLLEKSIVPVIDLNTNEHGQINSIQNRIESN